MRFDTKIAVVLRDDLAMWQKLNVASFLAGGLAGSDPDLVGEPYQDASGTAYGPLIRQPVLIFSGRADEIKQTHRLGLERGVRLFIYTADLFTTGHDAANRAVVAAVDRDALDLVGLAFCAERRIADKLVKGLLLHA
jgi:hypothetical protein